MKRTARDVLILITGVLFFGGCQQNVSNWSTPALLKGAAQRELADIDRLAVIEEIIARPLNLEQQQELAHIAAEIIGSPLHSGQIRARMVQMIILRYPNEAPQAIGRGLIAARDEQLQRQLLQQCVHLADKRIIPYLIEKRVSVDTLKSPLIGDLENAIEKLAGEPLDDVLTREITSETPFARKVSALECLAILNDRAALIEKVKSLPPDNPFIEPLRFWAGEFNYVPYNPGRLWLCQKLMLQLTEEEFEQLKQQVGKLKRRYGYEYDIRDSYLLLQLPREIFQTPPEQLDDWLNVRLGQLRHMARPSGGAGYPDHYTEDYYSQKANVSYTDRVRLKCLLQSLSRPEKQREIHDYLCADLAETITETGGLFFYRQGDIRFETYEPGEKKGDNQYVESKQLLDQAPWCLGRWHCHADPWQGRELAGPGVDDFQYARWHDCIVLIFTYIDSRTLNVDYLTPQGFVIDLGVYTVNQNGSL